MLEIVDDVPAATRHNDNLLRMAGAVARFGGWSIDLAEGRVLWSDEVAVIHEMPPGYSPRLQEGMDFYAPEWREKISEVFGACARDGTPYDEEMEIITKRGSFFNYGDLRLGQGRENAKEFLRQHADLAAEIEIAVRERAMSGDLPLTLGGGAGEGDADDGE